jgi:hypothetical protein
LAPYSILLDFFKKKSNLCSIKDSAMMTYAKDKPVKRASAGALLSRRSGADSFEHWQLNHPKL